MLVLEFYKCCTTFQHMSSSDACGIWERKEITILLENLRFLMTISSSGLVCNHLSLLVRTFDIKTLHQTDNASHIFEWLLYSVVIDYLIPTHWMSFPLTYSTTYCLTNMSKAITTNQKTQNYGSERNMACHAYIYISIGNQVCDLDKLFLNWK